MKYAGAEKKRIPIRINLHLYTFLKKDSERKQESMNAIIIKILNKHYKGENGER